MRYTVKRAGDKLPTEIQDKVKNTQTQLHDPIEYNWGKSPFLIHKAH